MGLWGSSGVVGLEVDTGIIRAVEMKGKKGTAKVTAAGQILIPDQAVVDGVVQDLDVVSAALQKLWRDAKFKSRDVVLGVFNQSVLMRLINFPKVPKDKLDQAIRLQAGDYFPIPMSQMVMDFSVVGEIENEEGSMYEVLLVAAKQQQLEQSIRALTQSKLTPLVVDAVPLALLRTVPEAKKTGTTVVVDLAMGLSSIVLAVNGMPRFARVLPINLRQYISHMGSDLDVGDLYNEYVAVTAETGSSENESFQQWCLSVAEEIRNSISYYVKQDQLNDVDWLLLSGRGARITGLVEFLRENLGVTVSVLEPAARVKTGKAKLQVNLSGPEFAVSTGLALRGLEV